MVRIKFFAHLRRIAHTPETSIDQEGTVGDVLEVLTDMNKEFNKFIYDEKGDIFIKILLNGRNIEYLENLDTTVQRDDILYLFPPVAGG